MSYRPNFETHAEGMRTSLARLVDFAERADQRDVLNNQALLNNTGKTNEALVVIGDLLSKLVEVTSGAKKAICDNQDCIHGGISRNGDLLAGIAGHIEQLVAAGGEDAILENMMDDLRPLDMSTMDQVRFGHRELVGVMTMGVTSGELRGCATHMEACQRQELINVRTQLSNAYDQLAQVNDRCNEIAAERDELARMLADRQSKMTKLQDSLADSQREVRSLTTDLDERQKELESKDQTISKQQKEISAFEEFMSANGIPGWHGQFIAWQFKAAKN